MEKRTQEVIGLILIILLAVFGVYSGVGKNTNHTSGTHVMQEEKGEVSQSDIYDDFPDSGPRE